MDAVSEVKSRLSIEDVVSEYVQLKRAGKNFKGLSPFTSERTPSFVVSPEKQIWHDFSSGRGGDMFTFVQEVEGLDFKGTLELLARKAGVDLSKFQSSGKSSGPSKERLYQILEATALFYQKRFKENNDALEYIFKKRAYTKDTVLKFQIGYSPEAPKELTSHLLKAKFTLNELKAAGVSVERRGTIGDMFRGRVMIPLHDPVGRVIGFTARILKDVEGAPKYINTPSTPLYDKSRHIYGLHLAKKSIQKNDFSVMVEGNLDVIASHQVGVRNVVATAGTALTEMHLKGISRFTGDVRLAFDEDKAGQNATERAIPIASKVGVRLSIISIPSGKDPDELIKKDPKLWEEAIAKSDYAIDWLIDRYAKILDLEKAPDKREFSDVTMAVVRQLTDNVEQDHFIAKIAKILGVGDDAVRSKLQQPKAQNLRKTNVQPAEIDHYALERKKTQDQLMALTLMRPSLRAHIEGIEPGMLPEKSAQTLIQYLQENPDFDGKLAGARGLKEITEYIKIVSLQYETLYQDQDDVELSLEAKRLRTRLIEQYVKTKKAELAHALQDSDESTTTELLEQAKALDALLKRFV